MVAIRGIRPHLGYGRLRALVESIPVDSLARVVRPKSNLSTICSIPLPFRIALKVASLVNGNDERGKMIRRNVVRYCNLSFVLGLRVMSVAVRKRFPTYDHVVESGAESPQSRILIVSRSLQYTYSMSTDLSVP